MSLLRSEVLELLNFLESNSFELLEAKVDPVALENVTSSLSDHYKINYDDVTEKYV